MSYDYPAKSLEIQARLMMFGLRSNHLMLMGAFVTAYGLFETTLERALWTLSEKSIEGSRPFTEKLNINITLGKAGKYHIEAYDISGRVVDKIFNGNLNEGNHLIEWNNAGRQSTGHYFIKVSDESNRKYEVVKISKL